MRLSFKTILQTTVAGLWFVGLSACTPPEELDGDELEPTMEWDDLVGDAAKLDQPPKVELKKSAQINRRAMSLDESASHVRKTLANLENPAPYAGGILGTRGTSKHFVASTNVIPHYDRLYWVMVRLLSEKYSCFIRTKLDIAQTTRITCRDGRQVLFWKKQGRGLIEFASRQFDRDGYEIRVIKHKIVRISPNRVI